jgi:protein-disulfide isomerase
MYKMRWMIAGLALISAALMVACSSGSNNVNGPKTNTNVAKKDNSSIPPNAPPGAQPPNQTGSAAASVTLEEFADFQCPQCAAKHPVMNEIKSMYGSRIHFIFRNFPLDIPAHDKSYEAAVAADAAGIQNKFWEMQNVLFTNQKTWTSDPNYKQVWKEYGTRIGLDVDKWENDMLGIASKARVDADKKRAQAIGVNSTPSLYINGVSVPFEQMTVDGLKQLVDAELAKAPAATQAAPAANAAANTATSNK